MALTPEDGSVVDGADSYVSLDEFTAYASAIGWVLENTDTANEVNLRRAFQALNRKWTYKGDPVSESQAGAFPREGYGVPQAIKDAQCELAYLIQGGLDPFATIEASKTSEMIKVGPITIHDETVPTGNPSLEAVVGLLQPYRTAGAGQMALMRA